MDDPMTPTVIVAIVVGSLLGFVVIWCLVVLLVSRVSGWHRLSGTFAAPGPPGGTRLAGLSGSVGSVRYRNCLIAHVTELGFFLSPFAIFRMGHPTLFVPWAMVTDRQAARLPWVDGIRFKVGIPPIGSMLLPPEVFEARGGWA
jgi:hypothetical protein